MRVTYIDHAFEQMALRQVSKSEVKEVLTHGKEEVQLDGRFRKTLEVGEGTLRVPFERLGPKPWTFNVITVVVVS